VAIRGPSDVSLDKHAALRSLPFDAFTIAGGFWAERQRVDREVSLTHGLDMLESAGNFDNLRNVEWTAVPYFLWTNREPGWMSVWLPLDA
jgi:hypothetical protein